jgi:hypothetical protein
MGVVVLRELLMFECFTMSISYVLNDLISRERFRTLREFLAAQLLFVAISDCEMTVV